jgi:hypothetical protein
VWPDFSDEAAPYAAVNEANIAIGSNQSYGPPEEFAVPYDTTNMYQDLDLDSFLGSTSDQL